MFDTSKAYSGFAVPDLEAATAFYGGILGIDTELMFGGGLLRLRLSPGHQVLVYPKADFVPATYTILNFPVADVDRAVDELVAAGVGMERFEGFEQDAKGIARGEGPTIAWFRDPGGNILAVHSDQPM
jgi:catechol 2,3-dioxygenase-like lactoylglutathione lyase family enzyme